MAGTQPRGKIRHASACLALVPRAMSVGDLPMRKFREGEEHPGSLLVHEPGGMQSGGELGRHPMIRRRTLDPGFEHAGVTNKTKNPGDFMLG